jgi:hypothetical protein
MLMSEETGVQTRSYDQTFKPEKVEGLVTKLVSQGTGPALVGGGLTVVFGTVADLFVIPQDDAIAAIICGGLLTVLGGLYNLYVYRRETEIYVMRYTAGSERAKLLDKAAQEQQKRTDELQQPKAT